MLTGNPGHAAQRGLIRPPRPTEHVEDRSATATAIPSRTPSSATPRNAAIDSANSVRRWRHNRTVPGMSASDSDAAISNTPVAGVYFVYEYVLLQELCRAVTLPRDRLIVALDVPSVEEAKALIEALGDSVGVYKIGLELLFCDGFALVQELGRREVPVSKSPCSCSTSTYCCRALAAVLGAPERLLLEPGQDEPELGAALWSRNGPDRPPMASISARHTKRPMPAPADLPRSVAIGSRARTAVCFPRVDTRSLVEDTNADAFVRLIDDRAHSRAGRAVLRRVAEQVARDLLDVGVVAARGR